MRRQSSRSRRERQRLAGAVERRGAEAGAELALGLHHRPHPGLAEPVIPRDQLRSLEVEEEPAEVERHREIGASDAHPARFRREWAEDGALRTRRNAWEA